MKFKINWANLFTALLVSMVISYALLAFGIGVDHPMILQNIVAFVVGATFPLEIAKVTEEEKK